MIDHRTEDTKFFITQTITLLTGAFSFVAAFAWNELIKQLFDTYLPAGSGSLLAKLLYALIVTLVALLVLSRLQHIQSRAYTYLDKRSLAHKHHDETHDRE